MSRECYDCSEDGKCEHQKTGVVSCGEGSDKGKQHRIKDLNGAILDIVDILGDAISEYKKYDLPEQAEIIEKSRLLLISALIKELSSRVETEDNKNE